jgi:hypothetical protein
MCVLLMLVPSHFTLGVSAQIISSDEVPGPLILLTGCVSTCVRPPSLKLELPLEHEMGWAECAANDGRLAISSGERNCGFIAALVRQKQVPETRGLTSSSSAREHLETQPVNLGGDLGHFVRPQAPGCQEDKMSFQVTLNNFRAQA